MAERNSLYKRVRVLRKGGFVYTIVMELSCTEPKPNNVSIPTNKQENTLNKILKRVSEGPPSPSLHRLCTRGTLCTMDDGRLDSQTTTAELARANLQFQIGNQSYAVAVLDTFPTEAPEGMSRLRIDDNEYGFTMNQIMASIQTGLRHSARTQTYTHITWRINKVYETDEDTILKNVASCAGLALKYVVKMSGKQLAKLFVTTGTKIGAKAVGKTTAKAVPVLGLGCGLLFGTIKLFQGDFGGAAAEVGSGVVSLVPGVGTVASLAIDGAIAYYDIKGTLEEVANFEWRSDDLMSN